jgi:SMC interacting uncharacterized protein involved in chromosome segregation
VFIFFHKNPALNACFQISNSTHKINLTNNINRLYYRAQQSPDKASSTVATPTQANKNDSALENA